MASTHVSESTSAREPGDQAEKNNQSRGKLPQIKSVAGSKRSKMNFSKSTRRQFQCPSGPSSTASQPSDIYEFGSSPDRRPPRGVVATDTLELSPLRRQRKMIAVCVNSKDRDMLMVGSPPSPRVPSNGESHSSRKEELPNFDSMPAESTLNRKPASTRGRGPRKRIRVATKTVASRSGLGDDSQIHHKPQQGKAVTTAKLKGRGRLRKSKLLDTARPKDVPNSPRGPHQSSDDLGNERPEEDDDRVDDTEERAHHAGPADLSNSENAADEAASPTGGQEEENLDVDGGGGGNHHDNGVDNDDDHDGNGGEIEDNDVHECSLFGQKSNLAKARRILKKAKPVGTFPPRDEEIAFFKKLCTAAIQKFDDLQKHSVDDVDGRGRFAEIEKMKKEISRLCEPRDQDAKDPSVIGAIYQVVLPHLVKVYTKSISCFEALDDVQSPEDTMTIEHLRTVSDLVKLALDMGAALYREYRGKDSVVQNSMVIHSDFTMVLRKVHMAFTSHIDHHDMAQKRKETLEHMAAQARRDAELQEQQDELEEARRQERRARQEAEWARVWQQEQLRAVRQEEINGIRREWAELHIHRRRVEDFDKINGRKSKQEKSFHLDLLHHEEHGTSFQCGDDYFVHVGPPSGSIERAREHIWSEEECDALGKGLRDWAGPGVFVEIFKHHCAHDGVLNAYNVTEIVTTAALLKETEIQSCRRDGRPNEDWIVRIPDWTRPHPIGLEDE